MHRSIKRRCWLRAGSALAAGLWLGRAGACEVQADFLRVLHPWTRATPDDATTAVLCMRIDNVIADDRLLGAVTDVASGVEMGGAERGVALDLAIPAGTEIDMHEQGLHLRLTGLRMPLQTGREYSLDLLFERSGTVMTTLSVDYQRFS